jgi:hypothetical protein
MRSEKAKGLKKRAPWEPSFSLTLRPQTPTDGQCRGRQKVTAS